MSSKIMEIVSAFGPLKAFHYKVNEDLNQPCAFFEVFPVSDRKWYSVPFIVLADLLHFSVNSLII